MEEVRQSLTAPGLRLPGVLYGDPADRILTATARIMGATLVTKDLKLIDYGIQSYISMIAGEQTRSQSQKALGNLPVKLILLEFLGEEDS